MEPLDENIYFEYLNKFIDTLDFEQPIVPQIYLVLKGENSYDNFMVELDFMPETAENLSAVLLSLGKIVYLTELRISAAYFLYYTTDEFDEFNFYIACSSQNIDSLLSIDHDKKTKVLHANKNVCEKFLEGYRSAHIEFKAQYN